MTIYPYSGFSHIHLNFYDVGNFRGYGPFPLNLPTTSVAENVSSFLSGIRASFRSENTNVVSKLQSKRMSQPNNTTHDSNV